MRVEVFVPTDNVTDAAPAIQAALDTGGTVTLPSGDIAISKPLRITKSGTVLQGDRTALRPNFGSGFAVLAQPPRPFPLVITPSLVPGPGGSVRAPKLLLNTEPGLAALGNGQSLCVSYFFRRESPAADGAAVHVNCGSCYAGNSRLPWGVWDRLGRLMVVWNGVDYLADPSVAATVGTVYFVALTYDGTRVRLLVGTPGQPLTAAVDVPFTGNVPMYTNGLDVVTLGFDTVGPFGQTLANGPADVTMDGIEFSSVVGWHPGDNAPTVKPVVQAGSVLIINWETDDPWVVGRRDNFNPSSRNAYILPVGSVDTQGGNFTIRDLTFGGDFGASGPCLYDTVASTAERLTFNGTYYGISILGSTYAGKFRDMGGVCGPVFWLQSGQSEDTTASGISPGAAGIPFVTFGSVGGSYTTLYISPLGGGLCSMYCNGSAEVNVFHGQVDDEGQAGPQSAALIVEDAHVKLNGVLVTRSTGGPLITCAKGGTVTCTGCWLLPQDPANTAELIHFRDPPEFAATVLGCKIAADGPPVTLNPEWCIYSQGFRLYTPHVSTA